MNIQEIVIVVYKARTFHNAIQILPDQVTVLSVHKANPVLRLLKWRMLLNRQWKLLKYHTAESVSS